MYFRVTIKTVGSAVVNIAGFIRFNMTAYAGYRLTCHEEFVVYRAVRSMTNATAFPHRFMFEDKRASLLFVTLEAFLIPSSQTGTQQHFPACSPHILSVHIMAV
jgi:hypothetical protein